MISEASDVVYFYGSNGSAYLAGSIPGGEAFVGVERKLKYTLKKGGLKLEDLASSTSSSNIVTHIEYTMTNNLYLFGQNYNGSARNGGGDFSVSSFKYYDKNGKLKCDLIPCYRKSDGKVGMYDFIRKVFLTSANSLNFTAGDTVGDVENTFKNWVKYSTEADDVTIYNNGQGYKDGTRIRSGGAEGDDSTASHTGFIPIKAGDTVRLNGYDASKAATANAINVYNSNHEVLGQISSTSPTYGYGFFQNTWKTYNWGLENGVKEEKTDVWIWTIPPDASIAYMRVTGYTGGSGKLMVVTVNEEVNYDL
jgi:hypothetical protein